MTRICVVDTETTGLGDQCDIWEIGLIVSDPGHDDIEYYWRMRPSLHNAEPTGLRVGRYYERIGALAAKPEGTGIKVVHPLGGGHTSSHDIAAEVARLLDGATIVGAVPDFDTRHLAGWLERHDQAGTWHYHIHCVETLALGYLAGQGRPLPDLPIKSYDLSRLIGVEPPSDDEAHTALGDARWARRIWNHVTGGKEQHP